MALSFSLLACCFWFSRAARSMFSCCREARYLRADARNFLHLDLELGIDFVQFDCSTARLWIGGAELGAELRDLDFEIGLLLPQFLEKPRSRR